MDSRKKIVVFGGSFNPPHIGHAVAIENLLRLFLCDELWVMPSSDRRDKKIGVSGKDRLAMLDIMISEFFPEVHIIKTSDLEINRPGFTATYDTLKELERFYPNDEFYFFIGTDAVGEVKEKWVKGDILHEKTKFVVINRPGAPLPENLPKNVILLQTETSGFNISSTFIRKLLTNGRTGMPYITKGVADYINREGLYRS
ncbi:MAG: nicotinate (nicotinamide) nucleotide adenylyltransferase [Patescibacteria group bacterium]